MSREAPTRVGILASDCYFPARYVEQSELEKFDGASTGKYQIGLGQERLAFAGAAEGTDYCV